MKTDTQESATLYFDISKDFQEALKRSGRTPHGDAIDRAVIEQIFTNRTNPLARG